MKSGHKFSLDIVKANIIFLIALALHDRLYLFITAFNISSVGAIIIGNLANMQGLKEEILGIAPREV